MTTRQEKRAYIVALVRNLEDLETIHCRPCTIREENSQLSTEKTCKLCPIYKEIRTIGELLSPESPKQKLQREFRVATSLEILESKLTVELYHQYKADELNDAKICEIYGCGGKVIRRWKKKNGLEGIKLDTIRLMNKKRGIT